MWTVLISYLVITISLLASVFFFDLSWDGQWYHQSAIYHLEGGWNPVFEPMRSFEISNDNSIVHFPKGSWYYAASIFSTFGNFESGKSINFILVFVSIFLAFSMLQDLGLSSLKSLAVAFLIAVNPVVWSETTTYLVDGSLVLYTGIYILTVLSWFAKPDSRRMLIMIMAAAGMITLKFTGLVFFCVLAMAPIIYSLIYKRDYLVKYIGIHAFAMLVSLFVLGYNPYVTNLVERGHPFYPIMGTEEYPSIFEQTGRDDNEYWETPDNMKGKPLLVRMFYANFGRPDNAPYYKARDAELIWPFTSRIADWEAYYFHETRVSGFGPYFGGMLVLSFILLIVLWIRVDAKSRLISCLALLSIFGSLLFSKHFWWPRFGPQMWLIPIISILVCFHSSNSRKLQFYTWIISAIMFANGCIVLYCHMHWETHSSIALRKQLTELQENDSTIEIAWGMFTKSVEKKLEGWHIEYEAIPYRDMASEEHLEMTSVVEGYPNMVLYRVKDEN